MLTVQENSTVLSFIVVLFDICSKVIILTTMLGQLTIARPFPLLGNFLVTKTTLYIAT